MVNPRSQFVPEMLALVSYDDDGDVGSIDLFGDDNSDAETVTDTVTVAVSNTRVRKGHKKTWKVMLFLEFHLPGMEIKVIGFRLVSWKGM